MKIFINILILLFLMSCDNVKHHKENTIAKSKTTITDTTFVNKKVKSIIQYTDRQLENYLDSIAKLSTSLLADKVSFISDSTFRNQMQMDHLIPVSDFVKLKQAIKNKEIDCKTLINIFGEIHIDSVYLKKAKVPLILFSFDKNIFDFNEYAVCLGSTEAGEYGWSCNLYFFKGNRIIAKHIIEHHYGLELKHYKDSDGKTIIYYKENFGTGSGIWQFNYYFYKYYNNKLIPVLNELENGNLQHDWGFRVFWLETFVVKTTPLTLKMVYYQELYNKSSISIRLIDDSSLVQYTWDENSRTLLGNYEKTKINKHKILTYFVADNELLFINTYYKTLKSCLQDKLKRQPTLNYLNQVKNYYNDN